MRLVVPGFLPLISTSFLERTATSAICGSVIETLVTSPPTETTSDLPTETGRVSSARAKAEVAGATISDAARIKRNHFIGGYSLP
ncbi:hypothetical protein D3C86_1158710 [compost metagenome]